MVRNPLALLRILATAAVLALAQPAAAVDWQPFPGEPMDTSALLKGAITDLYGNLLARTPNFTLSADEAEGIANVIPGKSAAAERDSGRRQPLYDYRVGAEGPVRPRGQHRDGRDDDRRNRGLWRL